jgi:RHS repeat-associated protein
VPSVSLPKGGGAIRGIGEKFSVNAATGTGSMSVPLPVSPGRSGFGPQLSLAYDSGAGNGPFGIGWALSVPSITRKTDRGLPRYADEERSDVFILSGAEDLVPVAGADGAPFADIVSAPGQTIHRYRPRVEGLFARIERWTDRASGEMHWRSISRENVTSLYGVSAESRVADPDDPARVFGWLLCESHDDRGNAIVYTYAAENDERVDRAQVNERNRVRSAARYLKRIRYGNLVSRVVQPDLARADADQWMFEVAFDYDDGHLEELIPDPARPETLGRRFVRASATPVRAATAAGAPERSAWAARPDAFSSHRAGFEVRTHRRCRRVLLFHRFAELGAGPTLVRATELDYDDHDYSVAGPVDAELAHQGSTRFGSRIRRVVQSGFVRDATQPVVERGGASYATYLARSLPPLELEYSLATIDDTVRELDPASLAGLPAGIDDVLYRLVDLDGEGLTGILTEQAHAWHYKRALGDGRFGPLTTVAAAPSLAALGAGAQQLLDLAGDGQLDLVALGAPTPGFYERTTGDDWEPFRAFRQLPNVRWDDPNLRFVDLNGDGHADVLVTEDDVLTWYPSLAEDGFGAGRRVPWAADEERGPRLVFADGTHSVFLADMCGDGLTDLVRVRDGEVCYWPNLGYGRFGAKVTMDNAPRLEPPGELDHRRVHLADIDGSGTTDIIHLGPRGARVFFNQSGNRWSDARPLPQAPSLDALGSVVTADLLGTGTACLVWSSPLPLGARAAPRYIDLMSGGKPHLLVKATNHLGAVTEVRYAPSTRFYLADRLAGTPWVTRLPFPVHCVERVSVSDRWRGTTFATTCSYHHGHFDGVEREFRGFGRVERTDVESYGTFARGNAASPFITANQTLYQPPVKTITWFHTGTAETRHFEREYFPHGLASQRPGAGPVLDDFREASLPHAIIAADPLGEVEWAEAHRACKGTRLREEVYELDVDALERGVHVAVRLFSVTARSVRVERLQARARNAHAVFRVDECESLTYEHDLDLRAATPRADPRVSHTLHLTYDAFGHALQSVTVGYPRPGRFEDDGLAPGAVARIRDVQGTLHVAYEETRYTDDVEAADDHRVRVPCETRAFELTGVAPLGAGARYFTADALRRFRLNPEHQPAGVPLGVLSYHELADRRTPQMRLVRHARTLFVDDAAPGLDVPAPLGTPGRLGLQFERYTLALTEPLLAAVFGAKLDAAARARLGDPSASGYLSGAPLAARFPGVDTAGQFWMRSGTAGFAAGARARFYLPELYADAFGNVTTIAHDARALFVVSTTDPLGNTARVTRFDFRVLAPAEVRDANDNVSAAAYDALGAPAATAAMGKGDEADDLAAFDVRLTDPALSELTAFFAAPAFDEAQARRWLGDATARHVTYLGEARSPDGSIAWGAHPPCSVGIVRERHARRLAPGETSRLQVAIEYSDGAGALLVTKVQAEPEQAGGPLRWIASGRTVVNNKGKPVKRYEPYFSDPAAAHRFEEPRQEGVATVVFYDALGRVVRTEMPDGSYERVERSPWQVLSFDRNDTLLEPDNAWFARHSAAGASAPERRAAQRASEHAGTPSLTVLDSLGRDVVSVAHDRARDAAGALADARHVTLTTLDAEGAPLWIRDARGNLVMQYVTPPVPNDQAADPSAGFAPGYDVAGNLLFEHGADSGDRWRLSDAAGQPMLSWGVNDVPDAGGARVVQTRRFVTTYDALRRPVARTVAGADPDDAAREVLFEQTIYGDAPDAGLTEAERRASNLRGRVLEQRDGAGVVRHVASDPATGRDEGYDFAGNALRGTRRFVADPTRTPDWSAAPALDAETFHTSARYDALGRAVQQVPAHSDRAGATLDVIRPTYDAGGSLAKVDVWLELAQEPPAPLDPGTATRHVVARVDYGARRQRTRIALGNGAVTTYEYDPDTFRLARLRTTRGAEAVQDLAYTYDAVGNVAEIRDDAQDRVFHGNACVLPGAEYRYDALYRLVAASGREHQGGDLQADWDDGPRRVTGIPNDCRALRNYVERYRYDGVGNLLQVVHHAGRDVDLPGAVVWNRRYQYALDSNRLGGTSVPGDPANLSDYAAGTGFTSAYAHDARGNMVRMPHLSALRWDFMDRLRATSRQVVAGGVGETTFYVYDSAGQRVRKVTQSAGGARREERLYLGGVELDRRFDVDGVTVTLERETLHVMDDRTRVALIETRLRGGDPGPRQLARYQLGNHLGSAVLELDDAAAVISYEEYHPYGSSAYRAARDATETPKRYGYTGNERDDESGLSYHGARHFASWLGRWASCDPAGMVDGVNLYQCCHGNPTSFTDPTGTVTEPLKERTYEGLRADLHLGRDNSLSPRTPRPPAPLDVATPARDLARFPESADKPSLVHPRPAPPATAIPAVPSTADLPSVDQRAAPPPKYADFPTAIDPDPDHKGGDPKDPSVELPPRPDVEAPGDPKNYRGADTTTTSTTTSKGSAGDITDQPQIDKRVIDPAQTRAGDILERDWNRANTGQRVFIVGSGVAIVGGALGAIATSRDGSHELFGRMPKLVIKLSSTVKIGLELFENEAARPEKPKPAVPAGGPTPRHTAPSPPPVPGEPEKIGDRPPLIYEPPGFTGQGRGGVLTFRLIF